MKLLKLTMLAFGFILLNASSCCKKDDEETLPPETQEGKNTFGCLVNDNIWIYGGGFQPCNLCFGNYGFGFGLSALNAKENVNQSIIFNIQYPLKIGIYYLINERSIARFIDKEKNCYYQTDSISSTGTLEITKFDSINKIVSGRFSFKASKYIPDNVDSIGKCDSFVTITKGRFDLKYLP